MNDKTKARLLKELESLRQQVASLQEAEAERREAERRIARLNRVYSVLSGINQTIVRTRDRQQLFEEACRIAVEKGSFRFAWIGLVDEATLLVKPAARYGHEEGYLERIRISVAEVPEGRGPTGTALREGRYFICNDIEHDPLMLPWQEEALKRGYRASGAFPIREEGRVIGALNLYASEPGFFDEEELYLLQELAADISLAMDSILHEAQRDRAESELRAERDFISAVLDVAGALVVVLDPQGRIVRFNRACEEAAGYSFEEVQGRRVWEMLLIPEEVEPVKAVFESLRSGQFPNKYENYWVAKDGSRRLIAWSNTAIPGPEGSVRYVIGTGIDITRRRQAEEEIWRLNADLERRVIERTARLEALNRELEAFSYSVSHDLRAPLRSIDGFSQSLLEDYAGRLDDTGRDYLCRVRAASQRMAQLIDDLLNLSRITRAEIYREEVDLSALARSIVAELQKSQPERPVEFTIAPGLAAEGDARLLRIALENLLNNAWKFTSKHPAARIEFGAMEQEGQTVYFIRDDGAGFDMAYADKLFGAFQRLHTASEFPGTGIGLATVQRIIHRHGGCVWARGEVERGATFYFTLTTKEDRYGG